MQRDTSHPNNALRALIGAWVQVRYGGYASPGPPGRLSALAFGRVEDCDGGFPYLWQPEGETLLLPLDSIFHIERLEPPQSEEARTLLRPSEQPPQDDSLLRPAGGADATQPDRLLRPTDEAEQEPA